MKAKEVVFIGESRRDLRLFPKDARAIAGQALYNAQLGSKHIDAKPLKGFRGATVLEIVADVGKEAFRIVYTVRFASLIYVLHCFQKKSRKGAATPRYHVDLVRHRLRMAEDDYAKRATSRAP